MLYIFYVDDALKMCRNIARQYSYFYSLLQVNYFSNIFFHVDEGIQIFCFFLLL